MLQLLHFIPDSNLNICKTGNTLTITYANNSTFDAIILSQQECEDVVEFTTVNRKWLSEHREPARMHFEWQRQASNKAVSEVDCICPKEVASVLIQSLQGDGEAERSQGDRPKVLSMCA